MAGKYILAGAIGGTWDKNHCGLNCSTDANASGANLTKHLRSVRRLPISRATSIELYGLFALIVAEL
jgi:hypothetical protein